MKLVVCTVRDRATDQFGNPHFVVNQGQAIRSFSDEINSKDGDAYLAKHPEDFDLFMLGTFDTQSGLFDTGVPQQISIGKSVKI